MDLLCYRCGRDTHTGDECYEFKHVNDYGLHFDRCPMLIYKARSIVLSTQTSENIMNNVIHAKNISEEEIIIIREVMKMKSSEIIEICYLKEKSNEIFLIITNLRILWYDYSPTIAEIYFNDIKLSVYSQTSNMPSVICLLNDRRKIPIYVYNFTLCEHLTKYISDKLLKIKVN